MLTSIIRFDPLDLFHGRPKYRAGGGPSSAGKIVQKEFVHLRPVEEIAYFELIDSGAINGVEHSELVFLGAVEDGLRRVGLNRADDRWLQCSDVLGRWSSGGFRLRLPGLRFRDT